jgi:hypothetical protein
MTPIRQSTGWRERTLTNLKLMLAAALIIFLVARAIAMAATEFFEG